MAIDINLMHTIVVQPDPDTKQFQAFVIAALRHLTKGVDQAGTDPKALQALQDRLSSSAASLGAAVATASGEMESK